MQGFKKREEKNKIKVGSHCAAYIASSMRVTGTSFASQKEESFKTKDARILILVCNPYKKIIFLIKS